MPYYPCSCSLWQRVPPILCLLLLGSLPLLCSAPSVTASRSHAPRIGAIIAHAASMRWSGKLPPAYAACMALSKDAHPCYSPQELQQAYGLTPLLQRGITGKGQNIVIIDSYGSPTALKDLKHFDTDYGLPDPPLFQQLSPIGTVPFNQQNADQVGWEEETSLDIQWAHAMAPQAGIIVLTSPVSETEGIAGMPQFLQLEQYALDHHLGSIISQSWSTTENTLFTTAGEQQVLTPFEQFYQHAASEHISVFAASGDTGSANVDVNNKFYPYPTVGYPAASPWVTAVGGTSLFADAQGKYQSEKVWDDNDSASGGGISQRFAEPSYQKNYLPSNVQGLLKNHRGLPDVSMNADPHTAVPVYTSFDATPGYTLFGGTSESAPLWCGLTALANQYSGHALGFLNPDLYRLGSDSQTAHNVFHDIVGGNNSAEKIPGYSATSGWDAATGWGTPIGDALLQAIAKQEQLTE